MNANRKANIWTTGFIAFIVAMIVALGVCSCGGLRKTLYTAAGGAGGAALGSTLGPGGALAGAALGAGGTQAFVENQELRDGTIVGEDALERQNAELRAMVAALRGDVDQIARDRDALADEGIVSWLNRWLGRVALVLGLGWIGWNGTKLIASPRGIEARRKLGWLRGLLAADGIKHTR